MVKNSAACGRVLAYSAYYIAVDIIFHIVLFVAQTYTIIIFKKCAPSRDVIMSWIFMLLYNYLLFLKMLTEPPFCNSSIEQVFIVHLMLGKSAKI
jgi:hypothetical protein